MRMRMKNIVVTGPTQERSQLWWPDMMYNDRIFYFFGQRMGTNGTLISDLVKLLRIIIGFLYLENMFGIQ